MSTTTVTQTRVCVVGDELVAGAGDPKALGWVGRVLARTASPVPLVGYPLAVPGETTTLLAGRWEEETHRRLGPSRVGSNTIDRRLVIAVGRADVTADVSLARSRLNLANILDAASEQNIQTLVVGPPPGATEQAALLSDLSNGCADVASRRRIPFVDLLTPLQRHEQWLSDMSGSATLLPSQAGYGLIAWIVLHSGWRRWLGLPDDPVV